MLLLSLKKIVNKENYSFNNDSVPAIGTSDTKMVGV